LAAFRHLFEYRDFRARPPLPAAPGSPPDPAARSRWIARLDEGTPLTESEGLALLAEYGVPVAPSREAETAEGAVAAATELGWPVAVKSAAPGLAHKSDADGVRLGIADEDGVRAAHAELS